MNVTNLKNAAIRAHLILHAVFFVDVNRFQECKSFKHLLWLPTANIHQKSNNMIRTTKFLKACMLICYSNPFCPYLHFFQCNFQLTRCQGHKELIAVKHSRVVTFYSDYEPPKKVIRFICNCELGTQI